MQHKVPPDFELAFLRSKVHLACNTFATQIGNARIHVTLDEKSDFLVVREDEEGIALHAAGFLRSVCLCFVVLRIFVTL